MSRKFTGEGLIGYVQPITGPEIVDASGGEAFSIEKMPGITNDEAADAAEVVTLIQEKYKISVEDIDTLYNSMLTIFVRGRLCESKGFKPGEGES